MDGTQRTLPADATVVEVDGSRFLLEWLDVSVLAAAAASLRRTPEPVLPR
ncbi:hypothetical protein ACI797_26205 [Geodermatophilus sp. SYSU D00691]